MSTSTGPNLESARKQIEKLMDDTADIVVVADGSFNNETGKVEKIEEVVYSGKLYVTKSGGSNYLREGGVQYNESLPTASLPLDSPVIPKGGLLRITSSRRDPASVGKEYRVTDRSYSTFAVAQKLMLELRT